MRRSRKTPSKSSTDSAPKKATGKRKAQDPSTDEPSTPSSEAKDTPEPAVVFVTIYTTVSIATKEALDRIAEEKGIKEERRNRNASHYGPTIDAIMAGVETKEPEYLRLARELGWVGRVLFTPTDATIAESVTSSDSTPGTPP